jgi:hypothetical protein
VIIDPLPPHRVRTAPSSFSHENGTFQVFQVVTEFFSTREGGRRREYEGRRIRQPIAWDIRQRPGLSCRVLFAVVEIIKMRGLVEEIGGSRRRIGDRGLRKSKR